MKKLIGILLLCSLTVQAEVKIDKQLQVKLKNTLNDIKKFKQEKNHKINNLNNEIVLLRKKFANYKSKKERELKSVKSQLTQSKQELSQNRTEEVITIDKKERAPLSKKVTIESQKNIDEYNIDKAIKQALNEMIDVPSPSLTNNIVITEEASQKIERMAFIPESIDTPWVEIQVGEDMDIYQLAQLYYGDREKYKEIYVANKQILTKNLKVKNGMSLKIPMTAEFKEQPMVLNTH